MKVTSLYSGADGESHFREVEFPCDTGFKRGKSHRTQPVKAFEVFFIESNDRDDNDWHPAPRRQIFSILSGWVELEVAGGTKRRFITGDIFIAEDTTGHGHLSRSMKRTAMVVPLA